MTSKTFFFFKSDKTLRSEFSHPKEVSPSKLTLALMEMLYQSVPSSLDQLNLIFEIHDLGHSIERFDLKKTCVLTVKILL